MQNKEIFYEAGLFKWQTRVALEKMDVRGSRKNQEIIKKSRWFVEFYLIFHGFYWSGVLYLKSRMKVSTKRK